MPIEINRIPRVDIVLISHNHYDHLDENSVEQLHAKFGSNLKWLVPLGIAKWFQSNGIEINVIEFNWWQSMKFDDLEFVFSPAQHWSGRSLFDRFEVIKQSLWEFLNRILNFRVWKTLWGGWIVLGQKKRLYYAGDTGYCPVFTQIGKKYGPFDLSFIPIGAYQPR